MNAVDPLVIKELMLPYLYSVGEWIPLVQTAKNIEKISMSFSNYMGNTQTMNQLLPALADLSKLRYLSLAPGCYTWDGTEDIIPAPALQKIATCCPLLEYLSVQCALRLNDADMWAAFAKLGNLKTLVLSLSFTANQLANIARLMPNDIGEFWSDGMVAIPSLRSLELDMCK
jgi:hypothetical protein